MATLSCYSVRGRHYLRVFALLYEAVLTTSTLRLQAFLRAVLQIHGEAITEHKELRQRAAQIEQHLRKSWSRIESLVEKTRCMVGLLSNQQI